MPPRTIRPLNPITPPYRWRMMHELTEHQHNARMTVLWRITRGWNTSDDERKIRIARWIAREYYYMIRENNLQRRYRMSVYVFREFMLIANRLADQELHGQSPI